MPIYIDQSKGKGRGVFAAKNFKKGDIIEVCPVIVLPESEVEHIRKTQLENYHFLWGESGIAICLGYGSIYNHSHEPNSEFEENQKDQTIIFKAIKDISKGEEITHDYEWPLDDNQTPQWFKDIYKK